jgi:hypothetical protein
MMLTIGDLLAARVGAQLGIAWLEAQRTGTAATAQIERLQLLIKKMDELLAEVAPGIHDDVEYDEEAIALVTTTRSIH